ncbi:hypothetical protein AgCh_008109 [Apium graveolens]
MAAAPAPETTGSREGTAKSVVSDQISKAIQSTSNLLQLMLHSSPTHARLSHLGEIEILCEGTEEVRSNQRRILVSQSEGFMAKPKENLTNVFERFNKLINDLQLHDKYYETEAVNLKFLLTLPDHLEQKISSIREGRDLSRMTLEVLHGILKTYELEMIQRKSLRAGQGHIVDGSSALVFIDS